MSITLSDSAAARVNTFLANRGKGFGLRLGVRTSGCMLILMVWIRGANSEISPRGALIACSITPRMCRRAPLAWFNAT
ncbi:hypothetical protein ONO39_25955, partial [Salmonella enterica subsp. enterica serovar Anatum]|nr:hypothetical protein [Salmonella enterica subsp. enterica serovar Anatum]